MSKEKHYENTSTTLKYAVTSCIYTILERVRMPEARISSKGYSLIYLIRPSVYSSRYLHELQTYLAKFELNLTAIIGHNSEKTYSSIDGSILLNILGKDVQTEPPNRIDAKAIDVIYSVVRYSAYS
jgi:hypothetical protein